MAVASTASSPTNPTKALWQQWLLMLIISALAWVVIATLLGTNTIPPSDYQLRGLMGAAQFMLLLLPVQGLIYTLVAAWRLRARKGNVGNDEVVRVLVSTLALAALNLVAAVMIIVVLQGKPGAWSGLAVVYFLGFWCIASAILMPIVGLATRMTSLARR